MSNPEPQTAIGKVVANLLSLEMVLRLFLHDASGPSDPELNLFAISPGDRVRVTPLTSYDTLGQLVSKVNKELGSRGLPDRVDASIVRLRDAIAHGRILAAQPDGPSRLLKFSQPSAGIVEVTVVIDLTEKWIKEQTQRTYSEIQKIVRLGNALGLSAFPES